MNHDTCARRSRKWQNTQNVRISTSRHSSDAAAHATVRCLIEVSTGVIVLATELEKDPLPNAMALMDLEEAVEKNGALPKGAVRLAIAVNRGEDESMCDEINDLNPMVILLKPRGRPVGLACLLHKTACCRIEPQTTPHTSRQNCCTNPWHMLVIASLSA